MLTLEHRLRRLETVEEHRSRRAVMFVLHPASRGHSGLFSVQAGGNEHLMRRDAAEPWPDFIERLRELATGTLTFVSVAPVTAGPALAPEPVLA